jgi:hypothetical protein
MRPPAKQKYMSFCIGCHGADAKGNRYSVLQILQIATGARLTDADIRDVLNGRNIMPAQRDYLTPDVHVLAAYVLSLGNSGGAQPTKSRITSPLSCHHHACGAHAPSCWPPCSGPRCSLPASPRCCSFAFIDPGLLHEGSAAEIEASRMTAHTVSPSSFLADRSPLQRCFGVSGSHLTRLCTGQG